MVGREVSKQPPWSIATSTSTECSFISAELVALDHVRRAGAVDEHAADHQVGVG